MKRALTLITICCCCLGTGYSQNILVWPGDANNDGKVSIIDVLHVGLSYNQQGFPRDSAFTAWQADTAQNITILQPTGLSIIYADCDGNGFVDDADLNIIDQNYNLFRSGSQADVFHRGGPGDPELFFDNPPDSVLEGSTVTMDVNLGDNVLPVDSFFGMVFSVYYDTAIVHNVSAQLNTANPFQGGLAQPLLFAKNDTQAGKMDIALSLKANTGGLQAQNISVAGPILKLVFIIEDNLIGKAWNDWNLDLQIDNIRVIDKDLNETLIRGMPANVGVKKMITSVGDPQLEPPLQVYPNPAQENIYMRTEAGNSILRARLINMSGCELLLSVAPKTQNSLSLDLSELSVGMYVLEVVTTEGIVRKRVVIQR